MTPGNALRQHHEAGHGPLGLAAGAAVMVSATTAATILFPASHTPGRLIVVAVAVGGCTAVLGSVRTSLAVAGLGYLLFVGFLANGHGVPSWEGGDSVGHLVVLALAAGLGLAQRWMRTVRAQMAFDAAPQDLLDDDGAGGQGSRQPLA